MTGRVPPRNLPTLTEVVRADTVSAASSPAPLAASAPDSSPVVPADLAPAATYPMAPPALDRDVLARQIFWQVRPQLEAELRNVAMDLFEAQFSALLPSLHLQIEEAVREAIDQALPNPDSYR